METKNIGEVIGEGVVIAVSSVIVRDLIDNFPKIVDKTKNIYKNVAEKRTTKRSKTTKKSSH